MQHQYVEVPADEMPTDEERKKVARFYMSAHRTTLLYVLDYTPTPVDIARQFAYLLAHEAFHCDPRLRRAE